MASLTSAAVHVLAKPTGAICNLDCKYCFFLAKEELYPDSRFRMSDEMLERFIRQQLESHGAEATIAWQGGEPTLMGVDFFRCSVDLANQCDHYVGPKYLLGNLADTSLAELATSPRQRAFGAAKRDALPRYCGECEVHFACHGECPKNRFIITPDGEPGLNYLCAGYKAFFKHIDRPMRMMAALLSQGTLRRQSDANTLGATRLSPAACRGY